jgi:hypothetical protein
VAFERLEGSWVGLERPAAWVWARQGEWCEVALQGGRRAWLRAKADKFTALDAWLKGAFTLGLNERWPKRLHAAPGAKEWKPLASDGRPTVAGTVSMPSVAPTSETSSQVTAPVRAKDGLTPTTMLETRRSYPALDIPLRSEPSESAPVVAKMPAMGPHAAVKTLKHRGPLPPIGQPMPPPPAAVLEARQGWYRLQRLDGSFAWAKASDVGAFLPFSEGPELDAARDALFGKDEDAGFGLRLRETRWVEGTLWLSADVLEKSEAVEESARVLGSGWLPASDGEGRLFVDWYAD